ncbi:hypothetical protein A0118_RS04460 [Acinetobacter baumannii]|uniref:hypothetical protein n=1 Tax=Acinetobacter calcoaceticus/baumannii complex TaxID=909768 RepID=UPI00028EB206|nr:MULTISPECIES: hypothetical protein [Acinetobacter calcoaceticus/baumannii complex]EHU1439446.1 hypothetical protein [Acinetobacter baumannii]EHU1613926.1 hypothetical protein [Acinetobacter baumannii]EHU1807283.1 hypothetical protein [Acinetobacter baumannii]EHU2312670.1 hypothetical protein [Acinetobacter baumannii]EHU2482754.1 hypothetical protein [Acinetobacter baumannii]
MNQDLKNRIVHLIEKGEDILKLTTLKYIEPWGNREVLGENGSELFLQWKISCKKVLKQISEIDYESFISSEKSSSIDTQPRILKRLLAVLRASLDDLNSNILDKNIMNIQRDNVVDRTTIHYHNLNNYGNLASHNDRSTITQNSDLIISKGDFSSLAKKLKAYGVDEPDIQNLREVIDVYPNPQSPTEYSDGVNSWIGKITVKALSESWQVTKDVGVAIFAELIKGYYGI